MADKNINENVSVEKTEVKSTKSQEKKPNVIKTLANKLVKFLKDTKGELKKVVWTPKTELTKSSKLVIVTVVAVCAVVALIDLGSSWLINSIAGLVG